MNSSIPVIATARSRLHADVMLIRLRRADIAIKNVSALFPLASLPNSVACWLRRGLNVRLGREEFRAVGPIWKWLHKIGRHQFSATSVFEKAKFDHASSQRLEEELKRGHTLLCVHAADEAELAIAWHIFKHAEAEFIALPAVEPKEAPAHEHAILAFPAFAAAIPV
jgi:hypothetical protein